MAYFRTKVEDGNERASEASRSGGVKKSAGKEGIGSYLPKAGNRIWRYQGARRRLTER